MKDVKITADQGDNLPKVGFLKMFLSACGLRKSLGFCFWAKTTNAHQKAINFQDLILSEPPGQEFLLPENSASAQPAFMPQVHSLQGGRPESSAASARHRESHSPTCPHSWENTCIVFHCLMHGHRGRSAFHAKSQPYLTTGWQPLIKISK